MESMRIISAQYINSEVLGSNAAIVAVIDEVTVTVPLDPANRHYAAILEWAKEDGNEIAEAD